MNLTVNTVEIKEFRGQRYAFYFSLVKVNGKWENYVSHHKCTGMNDEQAKTAFTREHFQEVETLVLQSMQNEILN